MIRSVADTSVNATRQTEQASLQVDLASFVALPVAQKQLYLAALEGDPRFAEVLPRLQAVLAAESGSTQGAGPVAAANDESRQARGLSAGQIAGLLAQVQAKGYGNSDYWSRTTADLVAMVKAFAPMIGSLAARESGAVHASLKSLAGELSGLSSEGYGNSDYWSARAGKARDTAHNVAAQLKALDGAVKAELPPKEALLFLAGVAESTTSEGYGKSDYWSKAAGNATWTAQLAGAGISEIAKGLPEPDRTVIGNLGKRLQETSCEGYGNSEYWSGRTADIVKTSHGIAATLKSAVREMA